MKHEDKLGTLEEAVEFDKKRNYQYTAPTIVKDEQGKVVAVTLTNEEHQVQEVLWQAPRELSDELPSPVLQEYFEKGYKCAMESLQLSDDEIKELANKYLYVLNDVPYANDINDFARAILKKAREK